MKYLILLLIITGCAKSDFKSTPGLAGKDGTNGSNGIDGAKITTIQFCKNSIPSYPAVFPEVGFCIDHQVYAVYSANDGFLVLVPPGAYYSNGINSSCTFTVLPDCVIQ